MKKLAAVFAAVLIAAPSFAQSTILGEVFKNAKTSQTEEVMSQDDKDKKLGSWTGGGPAQLGGLSTVGTVAMGKASRSTGTTGIIAGFNTSGGSESSLLEQFHVGIFSRLKLPLGFVLEPALVYDVKAVKAEGEKLSLDTSVGYLEVPVQLQWGIRMGGLRPYVFAEPYVGYGLNIKNKLTEASNLEQAGLDIADKFNSGEVKDNIVNRLEYGVGAGVGIDLGRLQLKGKYYWNMGNVFAEDGQLTDISSALKDALQVRPSMTGIAVSVGWLF